MTKLETRNEGSKGLNNLSGLGLSDNGPHQARCLMPNNGPKSPKQLNTQEKNSYTSHIFCPLCGGVSLKINEECSAIQLHIASLFRTPSSPCRSDPFPPSDWTASASPGRT